MTLNWNAEPILSNASAATFLEVNSFQIDTGTGIAFEISKNHIFTWLWTETKDMHLKHQPEMVKMVEHEILLADRIDKNKMKEMAKKDHAMAHQHANSLLLEPNEVGEIVWRFSTSAQLEVACNVPGHYETGMVAKIIKE